MAQAFDEYARYYDLLYKDKDYEAEVAYISNLLEKFAHENTRVLEFGSGTGIHGSLLANKSRKIDGIELSPEMVKQIQETEDFRVTVGDIANTNTGKKYGAVLSLFHVISYLTTREKQLEVFKNANAHLEMGGVFIFDVWYSPAVQKSKPEVRAKRMEDSQFEIVRLAEPEIFEVENNVQVMYSIFIREKSKTDFRLIKESHFLHHFNDKEISEIAGDTGFDVIGSEEFLTARRPSENTWGVCYILEKINEVGL